jgi:hypothetical protein
LLSGLGKLEISVKFWLLMATLLTKAQTTQLKDVVLRAIKVYNKYRSPEATATLVGVKNDIFIVDFEGSFCTSCGLRDYFEDLSYEIEDINEKFHAELTETKPAGQNKFRVSYKLKVNLATEVDEDSLFREFLLNRGLTFNEYLASNSCTKDVLMFHFRTWLFERKEEIPK